MLRSVLIFVAKRPSGNPIPVSTIYKAFGENIPRYLPLEGGDMKGLEYLFCVDKNVNVMEICKKYNYKCKDWAIKEYELEEEKFNRDYQIYSSFYSHQKPYYLEKYEPSGYDSD